MKNIHGSLELVTYFYMPKRGIFIIMNTIGYKNIDSSNYNAAINAKKANDKNDGENNVNESKELIYDLGTDIFVKSTDEDTTNSLYKPVRNKLTSEEAKALKQDQENLETDFMIQ
jgi:hypothetical protein